jgi:NADH dehydrogenase
MVSDIHPGHVVAGGWTIPTRTVIWAAGNVASPLTRTLGVPLDRAGRVLVEPDCSIPGHPEVFVLGDAAAFIDPRIGTLPGTCPAAIQMGQYAAKVIRGDLAQRPRRPFSYWDKGQLAVIGRARAVLEFRRFHLGGILAWLAWIFIHIFFLIGFRNRVSVLLEWAWSYATYQRGARLITSSWGQVAPDMAPRRSGPVPLPVGISTSGAHPTAPAAVKS